MSAGNTHKFNLSICFAVIALIGIGIYAFRITSNPAGFFVDESSIAYNAHTISQTGRDEFGHSLPLFFEAFGDYKNPAHIYLLALLFEVTGPGILTARVLSAVAGVLAALLLGYLVSRLTEEPKVPLLVMISAILTPWLFELSRVVLEAALYPLILVLFLLSVWRAFKKPVWNWVDVLCLSTTLALLTYTYSIGRLLAPLFALLLTWFYTRARLPGLLKTWAVYGLTLLPLFVYQRTHPEALTARFNLITYMKPGTHFVNNVSQFVRHYFANLDPRRLAINGDPNIYQVIHLYGKPAMLAGTVVFAVIGIVLILLEKRSDRWWAFVLSAFLVSVVPASLTVDDFHMLRLVALPVFLLLFTAPALDWLLVGRKFHRTVGWVIVSAILIQGVFFQWQYHRAAASAWRRHLFDADYSQQIFARAISTGAQTIYLADAMSTPYIQAYWYATLNHLPLSKFQRLAPEQLPPYGAVVISTEESCSQQNVIAQVEPYTLYVSEARPRARAPLPDNAFRTILTVTELPEIVSPGSQVKMRVQVKNASDVMWPGCERGASSLQLYLGSHWLDTNGIWLKEEGRTPISYDLDPGKDTNLKFAVIAPSEPGDYVLELDLLQERVAWFGLKGSPTTKVTIRVG